MPRTRAAQAPPNHASAERVTMGSAELDEMLGGGPFRDNIILVSGDSGTGKTTLAMEFAAGGTRAGERTLFVNFESGRQTLVRNARSIGRDLEALERQGLLRILASYPEARSIDEHLVEIKEEIEEYRPARVVIDSLPAMERITDQQAFRDFIVDLTALLRLAGLTALLTTSVATPTPFERSPHVSTVADVILLLAYVELPGVIERSLCVLKTRGSYHDPGVRRFWIDERGFHVGDPLRRVTGILAPQVTVLAPGPTEAPVPPTT